MYDLHLHLSDSSPTAALHCLDQRVRLPSNSLDGGTLKLTPVNRFWGLGAVLGPVIGGGFAQSKATWRW